MGFLVEKSAAESLEMKCFCLQCSKGILHIFGGIMLFFSGWFGMGWIKLTDFTFLSIK